MKPAFALSLSVDGIDLLHRAAGGWRRVGSAAPDSSDLASALAVLRRDALRLESGTRCKVIIPNDQIRYLTVAVGDADEAAFQGIVETAAAEASPYRLEELALDVSPDGPDCHIALVARETLAEAESFAREHGFEPVSFVAIPGDNAFPGEPFFGLSREAEDWTGSDRVEPDGSAVVVIGPAELPERPADLSPDAPDAAPSFSSRRGREPAPDEQAIRSGGAADVPAAAAAGVETYMSAAPDEPPESGTGDGLREIPPAPPEPSADRPAAPVPIAPQPAGETASLSVFGARERGLQGAKTPHSGLILALILLAFLAAVAVWASVFFEDGLAGLFRRDSEPRALVVAQVPAGRTAPEEPLTGEPPRVTEPPLPDDILAALPAPVPAPGTVSGSGRSDNLIVAEIAETEPAANTVPAPSGGVPAQPDFSATARTAPGAMAKPPVAAPTDGRNAAVAETGLASASPEIGRANRPAPVAGPATTGGVIAGSVGASAGDAADTEVGSPETDNQGEVAATASAANAAGLPVPRETRATPVLLSVPPEVPEAPGLIALDEIYLASIDANNLTQDAYALGRQVLGGDELPAISTTPIRPGSDIALDSRGLVEATPDGTRNPDGVMVYLGAPAKRPPPPPLRFQEEPIPDDVNARLAAVRPKMRPDDLADRNEPATFGGRSRAELAALRPKARPQKTAAQPSEATAADEIEDAVALAVVAGKRPRLRPRGLGAHSDPPAQAKPPVSGASLANVTAAPSTERVRREPGSFAARTVTPKNPTAASVARRATLNNAVNLRKINLIGVYGTPANRRALIRLPNGRYKKVKVGDRLDGGRVVAIGDSELRYQKGGRNRTLEIPSG